MTTYIFGYGSLRNRRSLQKTLPGKRIEGHASLDGYQRKMNAPVNGRLYLNLVPNAGMTVRGVLIRVTDNELTTLREREVGYICVNVTPRINRKLSGTVFTFIAPDRSYPNMKVPQSYLDTCLDGLNSNAKKKWIQETVIENEIEDDTKKPMYINAVKKDAQRAVG